MTDVDEFIDDFLQHKYDPVKRREYYLRTRELKGRGPFKTRTIDRSGPVFQQGKGVVRPKPKKSDQRILESEKRLARARQAAKKAPKDKRSRLEKKLDAAQKKLNQIKVKAKKAQQIKVDGKRVNVLLNNSEKRVVGKNNTSDIKLPKGAKRGDTVKVTDGLFIKERTKVVRKATRGRGGSV